MNECSGIYESFNYLLVLICLQNIFLLIQFLTSPYTFPPPSVRDYQITVKTSIFTGRINPSMHTKTFDFSDRRRCLALPLISD